jgi:hypothetical protein
MEEKRREEKRGEEKRRDVEVEVCVVIPIVIPYYVCTIAINCILL